MSDKEKVVYWIAGWLQGWVELVAALIVICTFYVVRPSFPVWFLCTTSRYLLRMRLKRERYVKR